MRSITWILIQTADNTVSSGMENDQKITSHKIRLDLSFRYIWKRAKISAWHVTSVAGRGVWGGKGGSDANFAPIRWYWIGVGAFRVELA